MGEAKNDHSLSAAKPEPPSPLIQKLARAYRSVALIGFNTILLLLFVAGIVFIAAHFKRREKPQNPLDKYGSAKVQAAYPGRSPEEVAQLLDETWGRPLMYEPYTQFSEAPFQGKYVNVAAAGYRMVENQGPWPPVSQNLNVFVFGGSTTFGYGVGDAETIASFLQRKLQAGLGQRLCVYNFGRAFYYSTQERILFANLLAAGIVPDAAVFVDGMNEFYYRKDAPEFTGHFTRVLNEYFQIRENPALEPTPPQLFRMPPSDTSTGGTEEETALAICRRYQRNRDLIEAMARAEDVKTVFVWQPVPSYKYDLKYHPFREGLGRHHLLQAGYQALAELRRRSPPPANELWLADMQATATEPLYVDAVHYAPKMCERIAGEIERFMREYSIVGPKPVR